jgi:hypothetical protein
MRLGAFFHPTGNHVAAAWLGPFWGLLLLILPAAMKASGGQ